MSHCIDIDRQAVEAGARILLSRPSRRMWQWVLWVIVLSISSWVTWQHSGNEARLEIGEANYSEGFSYFVKTAAVLIVASVVTTLCWLMHCSFETRFIENLGMQWHALTGGHLAVEISDNQIRTKSREQEMTFSSGQISELIEGERYFICIMKDPAQNKQWFFPVEHKQESFLHVLKKARYE